MVADALEKHHPQLKVELIICKTTGDKIQDKPLHDAGGKGLFTKELEEALLAETVDFAVHSFKDVPVTMPLVEQSNLIIAAVPQREDPRDVLVSRKAKAIDELPKGARVGTSSLRRRCQLLALRPDLKIELLRGNIDTRIRKLREGHADATILALAGLRRSGLLDDADLFPIAPEQMLPAPAQGAMAIQCRKSDPSTVRLISVLNEPETHQCVTLERSLVQALNGDCHSPIAALATVENNCIRLRAAIGGRAGEPPVLRAEATVSFAEPKRALDAVLESLEKQGVRKLLGTGGATSA
jgi:hydroxymethylbilane synthase